MRVRLFCILCLVFSSFLPTLCQAQSLEAGYLHTLGITSSDTVLSWGAGLPAPSAPAKAVSAGDQFSLALRSNGTVAAAGNNDFLQVSGAGSVSNATAISAGYSHGLALRADGVLLGWGRQSEGQLSGVGSGGYTAIDAGGYHSLALRSNGTVAAWGWDAYGQVSGAAGVSGATAISAGGFHSLALRDTGFGLGTVAAWGRNDYGQVSVPLMGNAVSVSAGQYHSVALRSNGTIAAWGRNNSGQTSTGSISNAVYAIAGADHTYFVLRNGTISSVGFSSSGARNTPNGFSLPTTVRWNAAADGNYLNSHRWEGRIPSTALSTAEFTKAGTYSIFFGNTAEAHGLNVTAGNVSFWLDNHQYLAKAVTISSGATFKHNGVLNSSVVVDNYGNYEVIDGGRLDTAMLNNHSGWLTNEGTVNGGAISNASGAGIYNGVFRSLSGATLNNSGTVNSWGSITLTGGLTNSGSLWTGSTTISSASTINTGSIVTNGTFNGGTITNAVGATIQNHGTLNGTTLDNDGSLVISSGAQANFTTITGAGSIVNNGSLSGTIALDAGGRLSGSGSYSGTLSVANGAVVAPGNSVGLMTGNNATWDSGGVFELEINDAMGVMGGLFGWDYMQLIGSLNITATSADRFLVNIKSLNPTFNGPAANFNSAQSYSWIFATASGGISGFDPSKFQIDYSSFMNSLDGGHFSISQNGNNLSLNFITAVPEPSSILLVSGGLVLCLCRRNRRTTASLKDCDLTSFEQESI